MNIKMLFLLSQITTLDHQASLQPPCELGAMSPLSQKAMPLRRHFQVWSHSINLLIFIVSLGRTQFSLTQTKWLIFHLNKVSILYVAVEGF